MPDWTDIISTAEAAASIRCHPDHISRLCRAGKVDCHRLRLRPNDDRASIWLVSRSSLKAYLETDQRWTWRRFRDGAPHSEWGGDDDPDPDEGRTADSDAQPVEGALRDPSEGRTADV